MSKRIPKEMTYGQKIFTLTEPKVVWKKALDEKGNYVIVKLLLPAGTRVVAASWFLDHCNKLRSSRAKVLSITGISSKRTVVTTFSKWDKLFVYRVGRLVRPRKAFSMSTLDICASGIHFFATRKEAVSYAL